MKKLAAEAAGTFGIVLCGTGAIALDTSGTMPLGVSGIALVFGIIVTTMILLFASISGAHLNPAVTLALHALRRVERGSAAAHIAAQLVGAVVASLTVQALFPSVHALGATLPSVAPWAAFLWELSLTCSLMLVILAVSRMPILQAALAIGATVGLEAYVAGPITGASMNPARSIAPALVSGHLEHLWLYIVAPICGALFAVACWSKLGRPRA